MWCLRNSKGGIGMLITRRLYLKWEEDVTIYTNGNHQENLDTNVTLKAVTP